MFEFKSIICVKMAQRTSANLIRALYNLSREHDSHKRKSLLNAGLIEMIKWFSLAARKIVQGKMKLPKQTQKFMDGCLYLKEEAPKHQVQWLLSAWNTEDVSLSVASLTAAGINHFITSELIRYINRPDSYNVAIGHYTPRQIEPQIILKFPSRESDYLLNN